MNKRKTSKKPSLIERAIETQKELTEAMIGLSKEVVRATDIREQARREHIASRIKQSYDGEVIAPLRKGHQVFDVEAVKRMRDDLFVDKPDKTPHRESIDAIARLAESCGRLQNIKDEHIRELSNLRDENLKLKKDNESLDRQLKNSIERTKSFEEQYQTLAKLHNELIAYYTPRSKSKRYYIRRVDARNVLKKLRGEK